MSSFTHPFLIRFLLVLLLGLGGAVACTIRPAADNTVDSPPAVAEQITASPGAFAFKETVERHVSKVAFPKFTDVHEQMGLLYQYDGWVRGLKLMVEATAGAGGTWLDVDSDGYLDAVFAQGCDPTAETPSPELSDRLFRNVDAEEFADITDVARLESGSGYGQGVAIGDFNNDGFDDIYLTRLGSNRLLENLGDGTFVDITDAADVDSPYWSASAAWADWDLDGDLDLFVCNYVDFDVHHPVECRRKVDGVPGMCSPAQFNGIPNAAFLNEGNGQFREAGEELGLQAGPKVTKSLGVVIAELTGDRWPDIFVANDETANTLFVGQDGSSFQELGNVMGCAFGRDGETQASMGVAFGDFDRNGMQDVCLSHFSKQTNTLYSNQPGGGGFVDASRATGLTDATYELLGWGIVMQDFNQDGNQDLFTANGNVHNNEDVGEPYHMRPQLLSFADGRWSDSESQGGAYFEKLFVGRGVSTGDFDCDGDFDLLVGHHLARTSLLRNDSERGNWLKLRLIGTASNRCGIGSEVVLTQPKQQLVAQIPGGTSYCSTQEPVLIFGLGDDDSPVTLEIHWPSGKLQTVAVGAPNRVVTVVETESTDSAQSTMILHDN